MLSKWYIRVVLLGAVFFGVVSQQHNELPNQEITLQFSEAHKSSENSQAAVQNITKQLQALGAKCIQVLSNNDGSLRITYFSDENVNRIEQQLASNDKVVSHSNQNKSSDNPKEDDSVIFNFDVSEINHVNNADGLGGKLAIEPNNKNDYTFGPSLFSLTGNTKGTISALLVSTLSKKFGDYDAIKLSNSKQHKTPEVRAGPMHWKDA